MRKRLHATKGDICVILPGFCVISPLKFCQRTSSPDARIIGVKVCINHKFAIKHQTAVIDSWQRKQISAFTLTMTLWRWRLDFICPLPRLRDSQNPPYGRSRVNVKVEPCLTFTRAFSYIASTLYWNLNFTPVGGFPLLHHFYARKWDRSNVWKAARKRKSWSKFNLYVYERLSIHCLYFIYAR